MARDKDIYEELAMISAGVKALLALKILEKDLSKTEAVALLSRFGLPDKDIAAILNTSPPSVRTLRNRK